MTFVKDDQSYWQCDRCKARLEHWPRYILQLVKAYDSVNQSPVMADYCETCGKEILEQINPRMRN